MAPVKWEERLAECEGFQWDAGNSAKIWDRHQVMPTECEELLFNRPLIVGSDEQHSTGKRGFMPLAKPTAADCSSWYSRFAAV